MPASEARKRRRRMQAQGVELVERNHIPTARLDALNRIDRVDMIVWELARTVKSLAMNGADFGAKVTILVGPHPSYPGSLTIEAKAAAVLKAPPAAPAKPQALADLQRALGVGDDDGLDDASAGGLIALP